jgi:predicted flap endonuclease-1-like 5' DNA nuclease
MYKRAIQPWNPGSVPNLPRRAPSGKARLRPRVFLIALTTLLVAAFGGAARASHYAVADVPRLVKPAEVEKLKKANVATTEELLGKAAKAKDRKALAKASGLPAADLLALAKRCDLLRIKGVGSEMVLLLEAAGVKTTADLAKQQPAGLMGSVTTANQAKKITEKPPTEPQLLDWISQAQKLPQVLEQK